MDYDVDIDWRRLEELNTRLTSQVESLNFSIDKLRKTGSSIDGAWKGTDSEAFKKSYAGYLTSVKNIVNFLGEVNNKTIPETITKHATTVAENTAKVVAAINS